MDHPGHVVAAGLVIRSTNHRLLMVQTFNRLGAGLILPGGLVEQGESPGAAASREVREELGLTVEAGRLLVVEPRSAVDGLPSSLQFVFLAEALVDEWTSMTKQPDEIAEIHWVDPPTVVQRHAPRGRARMAAALDAMATGVPIYLET